MTPALVLVLVLVCFSSRTGVGADELFGASADPA
jgi:hypothetical protein